METIWCAANRKEMMERAMGGEAIPIKTCNHTIDDYKALGRSLGVLGTPTVIFADGTLLGGYLPAEQLAQEAINHHL